MKDTKFYFLPDLIEKLINLLDKILSFKMLHLSLFYSFQHSFPLKVLLYFVPTKCLLSSTKWLIKSFHHEKHQEKKTHSLFQPNSTDEKNQKPKRTRSRTLYNYNQTKKEKWINLLPGIKLDLQTRTRKEPKRWWWLFVKKKLWKIITKRENWWKMMKLFLLAFF